MLISVLALQLVYFSFKLRTLQVGLMKNTFDRYSCGRGRSQFCNSLQFSCNSTDRRCGYSLRTNFSKKVAFRITSRFKKGLEMESEGSANYIQGFSMVNARHMMKIVKKTKAKP